MNSMNTSTNKINRQSSAVTSPISIKTPTTINSSSVKQSPKSTKKKQAGVIDYGVERKT